MKGREAGQTATSSSVCIIPSHANSRSLPEKSSARLCDFVRTINDEVQFGFFQVKSDLFRWMKVTADEQLVDGPLNNMVVSRRCV